MLRLDESLNPGPESDPPLAAGGRSLGVLALATTVLVIVLLLSLDRLDLCAWSPVCGPLLAEDISQGRLDTALPAPQPGFHLEQTFIPHHNGLAEIELILVQYGGAMPSDGGSLFTVELRDRDEAVVATQALDTGALSHNQVYTLRFAPQPASADHSYTLRLSGSERNHISVWGYSLDVIEGGQLGLIADHPSAEPPALEARELRFVTRYALTPGDMAAAASWPLRDWPLTLAALLLLPLPGVLLLLLARPRGWDPAAWLGVALALGVAAWPVLWQWLSLAGVRWSGPVLWAAVGGGWFVAIFMAARSRKRRGAGGRVASSEWRVPLPPGEVRSGLVVGETQGSKSTHLHSGSPAPLPPCSPAPLRLRGTSSVVYPLLLTTLLLATLATRFIAARDLAFPPWVDSSRHALITTIMVDSGQTPAGYEPFLPVDHFPYHFGFHTLSAGLSLMIARPLPELLLFLMQLLGGLLPLTVYAAGWLVTRRRAVGLLAAFLVALPFFFPGYYATWGRMTQLAAMLILPPLLALTWRLGRGWPRLWPLVGALAAGLFLTHFRVFLFYLPFALLAALYHGLRLRRARGLLLAGALGGLLALPRLIELLRVTDPARAFGQSLPGYNDFPTGYLTTGWERHYLILAAIGLAVLVAGLARRQRWTAFPSLLVLWTASLFALLAGGRLGLPESLVVNLNSMYITLFLPLALFLAITAERAWAWVERRGAGEQEGRGATVQASTLAPLCHANRRPSPDLSRGERNPPPATRPLPPRILCGFLALAAGVVLGLMALFGFRQQVNILNPQTILALPADTMGLNWMDENLPADARVAVNAWRWLGETWAGADGGAWITPLTGRQTTTPPIDHIYNRDLFLEVRTFNAAASADEDWSDPASAAWLAEQGVTHVFVGRRGGAFDPAELSRNPGLSLLYQRDGVFIFAVK